MKILIIILALSFSTLSMADEYCSNEIQNAYIVKYSSKSTLKKDEVLRAEIIIGTKDMVVAVPCFRQRAVTQDAWHVESFIISKLQVFKPIQASAVGNFRAVGYNPWTRQFLVLKNNLFADEYLIVKSKSRNE